MIVEEDREENGPKSFIDNHWQKARMLFPPQNHFHE